MFRLHLDQSFEEIYEAPYQRLSSFQTAYQQLIRSPRAVDPTAAGTPAIDPYTGLGFRRRGKPGASGNCCYDRRARPLPKAPQKQSTIERFAALIAESLFTG